MAEPLVSVVIPAYNTGALLRETVESALAQTHSPLEVIVVDDGSSDDTPQHAAVFGDRIRYIHQENRGGGAARNAGVEASRGAFIALLDHDDLWHPEKIERQLAVSTRAPESGLIVCDGREKRGAEVLSDHLISNDIYTRLVGAPSPVLTVSYYERLLHGNVVACFSTTLIPQWVFERVGPLSEARDEPYDYEYFLRIASRFPITFHRDHLVTRRYLETARSGQLDRRHLVWALMDLSVLERQFLICPEKELLIRSRLDARIRRAAKHAYRYGREHDRAYAIGYLERLWKKTGRARVAGWLLRLVLPGALRDPESVFSVLRLLRGGKQKPGSDA